jgi:predicted TIM-barrel fold metal-dependent hydrolase
VLSRPALRPIGIVLALALLVAFSVRLAMRPDDARDTSDDAAFGKNARARLPMVDLHVHVAPEGVPRLLDLMQRYGVAAVVNLSGGHLDDLDLQLAAARGSAGRIVVFTTLAYEQVRYPDFGERMALLLRDAHARGARGLKIAKLLGLGLRTRDGKLLRIDDPRLDIVFDTAAELGMPVAIHSGDPRAFWLPVTPDNPRRAELEAHPGWALYGRDVPPFGSVLAQLEARIARHPKTTFISVHFGNCAEDPDYVARLLRTYPNLYIDTAARIPEMGRHSAARMRDFFAEFQDRILFGSDLGVGPEPSPLFLGSQGATPPTDAERERFFSATRRYFETNDVAFEHPTPIQGDWKIDGIGLPREVLEKVYFANAVKLLGLDPALLGGTLGSAGQ